MVKTNIIKHPLFVSLFLCSLLAVILGYLAFVEKNYLYFNWHKKTLNQEVKQIAYPPGWTYTILANGSIVMYSPEPEWEAVEIYRISETDIIIEDIETVLDNEIQYFLNKKFTVNPVPDERISDITLTSRGKCQIGVKQFLASSQNIELMNIDPYSVNRIYLVVCESDSYIFTTSATKSMFDLAVKVTEVNIKLNAQ